MKKNLLCLLTAFFVFNIFAEQKSFLIGTENAMNDIRGATEFENSLFVGFQYDNFSWIEYMFETDEKFKLKNRYHYNMINSEDKNFVFYFEQGGKKYVASLSFYTDHVDALEVETKQEGLELLFAWTYNQYFFDFEKYEFKKYPLGYWSKESFTLKFPESFRKKYGYSKEINDRFVVEVVNAPKKIVKQIKDSKGYYLCNRPYPRYKRIELFENHSADCMADLAPQRMSFIAPVKCVYCDVDDPNILKLITY